MMNIINLPIELLVIIFENIYILDDLINLYKTCKVFKNVINNYKMQLLYNLFKKEEFSNSYYNLFYSFINRKYEFIKKQPYRDLKQLLEWNWEYKSITCNFSNIDSNIASDIDIIRRIIIKYLIEEDKFRRAVTEDSLIIIKNFIHLTYLPSKYIFNSKVILNKYFNVKGLSARIYSMDTVNLQSELIYYINHPNLYRDNIIFNYLYRIYPDLLINHIVNFEKFVSKKKFKKILHNFTINLFLEWLFDKECNFIEKIYKKLNNKYPDFIKRTLYRIIYADFENHYQVTTEDFTNEFYVVHRIFLPSEKIVRLYNDIKIEEYRALQLKKGKDWKKYLNDIKYIFL